MHAQLAARGLVAAVVCLAAGALTPARAQPGGRNEWLLLPQLARGQELTYSGWFTEKTTHGGVESLRTYRLESTLLVLDADARKWDVAFLTVLTLRSHLRGAPSAPATGDPPSSVRLEVCEVDRQGRVRPKSGAPLLVPLDGPPTAEHGAFVEVPRRFLRPGDNPWPAPEPGRPARVWQVDGTEAVQSTLCARLVGAQQSEDWEHPRADRSAWRRQDTVWLSPQQGLALKVKRVIERREAARAAPTYRAELEYEREGHVSYHGQLFEGCSREVEQAVKFNQEAEPLLRQPDLYRPQIEALLRRIRFHLQQRVTVGPYRKAVLQVQRRVEAASRGEVTPGPGPEPGPAIPRATPGQRVPDFAVSELIKGEAVQLYRHLGRPVVLMFYNPATPLGQQVLRFGQDLCAKHPGGVTVLALAVTEDEELVRRQYAEMHLTFPILDGRGLHQTYGVTETPRLVVLDGHGIYRGGYTGWGVQTPREVYEELRRWLPSGKDR
jgi:peroxiredoxin